MDFSLILCGEKNFYRTAIISNLSFRLGVLLIFFCILAIFFRESSINYPPRYTAQRYFFTYPILQTKTPPCVA